MNHKKHIILVYLGNFFFDARLINMALSLLQENYKVSIIHTYLSDRKLYNQLFQDVNFYDIHLQQGGWKKYLEFHNKVKKILQKEKYDTILSGDLYSLGAVTACKHLTKQIIYDCREIYFELAAHNNKPFHRYWNYLFEKYHLQYVDKIIVTADTDLQFLQKNYQKHTHLIWYTIYNYPFQNTKKNLAINNMNNNKEFQNILDKDQINIIYQGVIQKGRGIKELIDLANYNSNISAIVVGSGEHSTYYENYNKTHNKNNNVYFIGSIPYLNLFTITAQCDLGWAVITKQGLSNKFALPNKLFEYLISEIPVIASDLPNIRTILQQHNVGKIISEDSSKTINKIVIDVYKNKAIYQKNIRAAANLFNWNVQHDHFMEALSV